jgi:hypothetical protein
MRLRGLPILPLLSLAALQTVLARDTTVVFASGYQEGVIRLEIQDRVVAPSPDLLQGIRFNLDGALGPDFLNTGLPDFNTSCNTQDYSALVVTPGASARLFTMGFGPQGDTSWNGSGTVPSLLTPLDSIKDRYPFYTKRDSVLGRGWVYSAHVGSACRTYTHQAMPGHRRIFYFRRGTIALKVQVERFDIEPVDCGTGLPCNRARHVHLRYGISDSARFPTGITPRSVRGSGIRPASPRPPWTFVLGRNAVLREIREAARKP